MALSGCGACDLIRDCNGFLGQADYQRLMSQLQCDIAEGIQTLVTDGGGGGGGGTLPTEGTAVTPTLTIATGSGSVTAGARKVSFSNAGGANATILGVAGFPPGASVTFEEYVDPVANTNHKLAALSYDGSGTTLIIAVTT